MIFTLENCDKILRGEKTMTRRIVRGDETINRQRLGDAGEFGYVGMKVYAEAKCPIVTIHRGGRLKYQVGRKYAVCPGRGKKAVGRIKITAIRRERLQDISEADSTAEGAPKLHRFDDNLYMTYLPMRDGFRRIWDELYGNDKVKGWEANPDVWVISFELVASGK